MYKFLMFAAAAALALPASAFAQERGYAPPPPSIATPAVPVEPPTLYAPQDLAQDQQDRIYSLQDRQDRLDRLERQHRQDREALEEEHERNRRLEEELNRRQSEYAYPPPPAYAYAPAHCWPALLPVPFISGWRCD
ncbi:MAG TPA: hypothetical protein VE993_07845 [Stellaceae bacterium]|nr:hypothetical protein [Stellaceae bacterium]